MRVCCFLLTHMCMRVGVSSGGLERRRLGDCHTDRSGGVLILASCWKSVLQHCGDYSNTVGQGARSGVVSGGWTTLRRFRNPKDQGVRLLQRRAGCMCVGVEGLRGGTGRGG